MMCRDTDRRSGCKKRGRLWQILLFCLALLVFVFSLGSLLVTQFTGFREEARFQALAKQVESAALAEEESPQVEEVTGEREVLPQYRELFAENPDLAGWIQIEGTDLDYPVMFTPEEPEFYLRRDFYGNPSQSGVPFLDGNYQEEGNHALIYGHNMDNGTMFATLLSYRDPEFWEEHPTIRFDTLYETGEYEVVAAFYGEILPLGTEGSFPYYTYTDLRDPKAFSEYLAQVEEAALYETGVTAVFGDAILTLSTCSNQGENGRFCSGCSPATEIKNDTRPDPGQRRPSKGRLFFAGSVSSWRKGTCC